MEESGRRWRGWLLALVSPGIVAALVEAMMANELMFRLHSNFVTSAYRTGQIRIYIFTMILVPTLMVTGVLEFRSLEKSMLGLGADEKAISALKKSMRNILVASYFTLALCVEVISGFLWPQ